MRELGARARGAKPTSKSKQHNKTIVMTHRPDTNYAPNGKPNKCTYPVTPISLANSTKSDLRCLASQLLVVPDMFAVWGDISGRSVILGSMVFGIRMVAMTMRLRVC